MNPMFYGTFAFLGFMSFFVVLAAWMIHGIRREEAQKRAAGSASTAAPESRSQSAE